MLQRKLRYRTLRAPNEIRRATSHDLSDFIGLHGGYVCTTFKAFLKLIPSNLRTGLHLLVLCSYLGTRDREDLLRNVYIMYCEFSWTL